MVVVVVGSGDIRLLVSQQANTKNNMNAYLAHTHTRTNPFEYVVRMHKRILVAHRHSQTDTLMQASSKPITLGTNSCG